MPATEYSALDGALILMTLPSPLLRSEGDDCAALPDQTLRQGQKDVDSSTGRRGPRHG